MIHRVARIFRHEDSLTTVGRGEQLLLQNEWRRLVREHAVLPPFADVEFRAFSQNSEDGMLLYVLTLLGFTNRVVVELGCGDGRECNSTNLILNHGCSGLLVDGDPEHIKHARDFFRSARDSSVWPPTLLQAFLTRETVNALVGQHVRGSIDLLSIDVDGMDYWLWEALTVVEPRVVVVEANNVWGPDQSVAVPYSPAFQASYLDGQPDYSGASLLAFTRLAARKGYRLVGAQRYGFNAVFVRQGLGEDLLPEVSVASCLNHPQSIHAREVRGPRIVGPIVTIE